MSQPDYGCDGSEVGEYFQDEALVFGFLEVESDLVGQQSILQGALQNKLCGQNIF